MIFYSLQFFECHKKIPQEIKKCFTSKDFNIVSGEFSSFSFMQIRAETFNI